MSLTFFGRPPSVDRAPEQSQPEPGYQLPPWENAASVEFEPADYSSASAAADALLQHGEDILRGAGVDKDAATAIVLGLYPRILQAGALAATVEDVRVRPAKVRTNAHSEVTGQPLELTQLVELSPEDSGRLIEEDRKRIRENTARGPGALATLYALDRVARTGQGIRQTLASQLLKGSQADQTRFRF